MRITAQLIDGGNDRHVWSDRYDGTLEDIFTLQDEITFQCLLWRKPALRIGYPGAEKCPKQTLNEANSSAGKGTIGQHYSCVVLYMAGGFWLTAPLHSPHG